MKIRFYLEKRKVWYCDNALVLVWFVAFGKRGKFSDEEKSLTQ